MQLERMNARVFMNERLVELLGQYRRRGDLRFRLVFVYK